MTGNGVLMTMCSCFNKLHRFELDKEALCAYSLGAHPSGNN
jgi:hypothetical protein